MTTVGPRRPDQTPEEYRRMVVSSAPPLTDDLAARLAALLPMPVASTPEADGERGPS